MNNTPPLLRRPMVWAGFGGFLLVLVLGRGDNKTGAGAQEPAAALGTAYAKDVRPLLLRYCKSCHSKKDPEAEVDFESLVSMAEVRKAPKTWQKALEMLDSGQMPPKDAKQPTEAERTLLRKWVREFLTDEAKARAGDPGRVVLRRLSNAEYIYTLRDLTGIESLNPAKEFPVDGAAGEGFTNTGNALVMSPALFPKYLDAAKAVAGHAVLLPDGLRFSPHTTRRDWTDETLKRIRDFYREFTDPRGGDKVNLQGIVFDTNQGGRLPVEKYLAATLVERAALQGKTKTVEQVAQERQLSPKYLGLLWEKLNGKEPSLLLDRLRSRWRDAKPEDAATLTADIAAWQKASWQFTTVGHIGKVGGPKAWLEPTQPFANKQEIRFKIPTTPDGKDVVLTLLTTDAGDGNEQDIAVWEKPRLVAPGRPDLLLRDVRDVTRLLAARRQQVFANAAKYLSAADEVAASQGKAVLGEVAAKHGLEEPVLRSWLDYLGIGAVGNTTIQGHFTKQILSGAKYDFIKGWGSDATPLLLANSSDMHVRIPGNMKPHGVAVHPSPTSQVVVGWRSPATGELRVEGKVTHAHPECGNGVTWALELRRGGSRQRLAAGIAQGSKEAPFGPLEKVAIQKGDVLALAVGPRDANHSCDLTALEWKLSTGGDKGQTWDLGKEVSKDVLAGNPRKDLFGNEDVWHFFTEPDKGGPAAGPVVPPGSVLAQWRSANGAKEKQALAEEVQKLLVSGSPGGKGNPNAALYQQLASLSGPLLRDALTVRDREKLTKDAPKVDADWGVDPSLFGKHPQGKPVDAGSLVIKAPSALEVRLPAELASGCELVATGVLDPEAGAEGSVQFLVQAGKAGNRATLQPGTPIVVRDGGAARKRWETALGDFRHLFPAALCYTKIVPVDEVVTLTLFYREDHELARLMLDEKQKRDLDRLWGELRFISQDALTLVDAFQQLMEYATQDSNPKLFEPLRKPINDGAAAFKKQLVEAEPKHLNAVVDFAGRAFRRPLTEQEAKGLRVFYEQLRKQKILHEEALRLTMARVLVSPAFLYRAERPGPGENQTPVNDWELASRLSYFLWASQPDEELRQVAAAGKLRAPDTLLAQTRRMLRDPKTRRLATEFACQWLHIYDFDPLEEKSERHFPTFVQMRGAMYEESIQFFTDLFQNNRSVFDILDADHTFLNEALAKHYGIPGVKGPEWRRVDGVKKFARGGILGQASTLAKQSGASRTSPILRGNWISEVLLGERLPRPPKGVPQLPDDETKTEGLSVRELVERHAKDPKCAICHQRIDPFGFSLEGFDAIGRRRDKDLGGRPISTRVKTPDGVQFEDIDGLRGYLLKERRAAFLRQFCKKLLGYSLGRSVQLSDEFLLTEMQSRLQAGENRVNVIVETIVQSRQFREIRGKLAANEE